MEQKEHELYKRVAEKDADACAWVFTDEKTFEKYYYKHPELGEEEVRIRILSTGLCMSDSHFCRGKWGKQKYYPVCPGHELVGEVEEWGSKVDKFFKGEKVMMGPFR